MPPLATQVADFRFQISNFTEWGRQIPSAPSKRIFAGKTQRGHRANAPWAVRVCVHSVSSRWRAWRRIPADLRRFGRLRRPPQTATRLGLRSPSSPPSPPPSLPHRTPPITVQVFENAMSNQSQRQCVTTIPLDERRVLMALTIQLFAAPPREIFRWLCHATVHVA